MNPKPVLYTFILLLIFSSVKSQDFKEEGTSKYLTWALVQFIPSPTLFQDTDGKNSRLQFGLKWHITPLNISFKTNKYVSHFQFFMINPVRRFTGSVEAFLQPEILTRQFKYSNLKNIALSSGIRIVFPLSEYGEDLCGSIGMKYTYRKDKDSENYSYTGVEAGLYFFAGTFGLQYTQNFNSRTNFNLSFYIKYF